MIIGGKNPREAVCLVAEIGINHEGSLSRAKEIAYAAAASGADAVKIQTCVPELFAPPGDHKRLELLQRFHLTFDETEEMFGWARENGIHLFSTPLDLISAAFLAQFGHLAKVSSGDITFLPLLDKIANLGMDIILSTGGSNLTEIAEAVNCIMSVNRPENLRGDLGLMHCVSLYPAPYSELNLSSIPTLQSQFPGLIVGYSDHSIGLHASLAAVALGARIIEKHFTLDKSTSDFRDHQLSVEPRDLAELRLRIDVTEATLGNSYKRPNVLEANAVKSIRRSIFFKRNLDSNVAIAEDDLTFLRPGTGLGPGSASAVIGRRLRTSVRAGDQVTEDMLAVESNPSVDESLPKNLPT